MNGLEFFAKYALPPNILGYCGPANTCGIVKENNPEELRRLLSQFEGAVPYLRLIASANSIKDIFDYRVIEAYWLGNDLLKNVPTGDLYGDMEKRFKKRMRKKDWHWLISGLIGEAKPHHVFHVLDIYRRIGFMRSGAAEKILETINNCRISWGKVVFVEKNQALIEYFPLEFFGNKLDFGGKKIKNFLIQESDLKSNDDVSLHWNYVCGKITGRQVKNLSFWTKYHLDLANRTI